MKTINTSKCEKCKYGTIDEVNKGRIVIHCSFHDKDYLYGTRIVCDKENKNNRRN